MKSLQVAIRKIGNSQGIVIPKPILVQLGLDKANEAHMTVEGSALVIRKQRKTVRKGWAEAAKRIAEAGDDALVLGEFDNSPDSEQ